MARRAKFRPMVFSGRRATAADAGRLSELAFRSKAVWGYSDAFMEQCREELTLTPESLEQDWGYLYEGALDDGDLMILGFVLVSECAGDRLEKYHAEKQGPAEVRTYEVEALFVEPAHLGGGFGRRLFQAAVAACQQKSPHGRLLIQSDPNAAAFYASCGALEVGRLESASIPGRELPLLALDW